MTVSGKLPQVRIDREAGRRSFGADPAGYDDARPAYPEAVYALLEEHCGLGPGTCTLEIGSGTGIATEELLARGASPLVALEPDTRLAGFLGERLGDRIELRVESFEDAQLESAHFDLVVCATALHWIDASVGLSKVGAVLRPGGWWAAWWTVFGDPDRADPFHDATHALLQPLAQSPSAGVTWRAPYSLDVDARLGEIEAAGCFEPGAFERFESTLVLDATGVRSLYGTFSSINVLPEDEREKVLDALVRVAEREFGGRVERNLLTPIYTARHRS